MQKFVELFVVVDNTEVSVAPAPPQDFRHSLKLTFAVSPQYKRHGSGTKARILGAVNHIDKVKLAHVPDAPRSPRPPHGLLLCLQLYRTLNIRVILVGLEIWTYRDLFDVDSNPETTLDKFLLWRQSDLLQRTKHDNAQFVT